MSTVTEIQEAILQLPSTEQSAIAIWLQSRQSPEMSDAEEAALLRSLDAAAAEMDAGKGIPIEGVRPMVSKWAGK